MEVLVNATLRRDGEQATESIIGSIRDISDVRRAEEARRETEERLRLALDASRAGTFEVHPRSAVMLSPRTKQHFGIAPEREATNAVLWPRSILRTATASGERTITRPNWAGTVNSRSSFGL